MNRTEVLPGVWHLEEDYRVYCTLVQGKTLALLWDTGQGRTDLAAYVAQQVPTPCLVLNSHGHSDHIGGNFRFPQVYAHRADWPLLAAYAQEQGLEFSFGTCELRDVHPNSALIRLEDAGGGQLEVGASSPGGGRIRVFQVDGLDTSFSGELPTLVVHNSDQPGCVSQVTGVLANRGINVATLQLNRGGSAVMVIQCDQPIPTEAAGEIRALPGILRVSRYTPEQEVSQ